MTVPHDRIRQLTDRPVQPTGEFVLYWMTSARRATYNYALERAVEWALQLGRPMVVLEALRLDYRWASARTHAFILEGMAQNARALNGLVTYYPYVEPRRGAGKGLLHAVARHACVVITDDFPAFFLPRMVDAAARQIEVRFEAVDSNGVIPLNVPDRAYPTAHAFRRFVHARIDEHGVGAPLENPLAGGSLPQTSPVPAQIVRRWEPTDPRDLANPRNLVSRLDIDQDVDPCSSIGGSSAANDLVERFLHRGLDVYARDRNDPDADGSSGLSPYLHFGHLASVDVIQRIIGAGSWDPTDVEVAARGSRSGWGGRNGAADFLDQLVTWRELGYNMCARRSDYDVFESLPDWARITLAEHACDPRPSLYTLDQFDRAETHDALWNAAQRQLRDTGTLHNYMRMLWGKKILEWSAAPEDALATMVELNNRYALDGRDPNSYSGIFWILGRYDRAWGPERAIFGKIRYMSSANTKRKLKVTRYLERFGPKVPR
jgi:deoxyribodipyrimidine photo-lyase